MRGWAGTTGGRKGNKEVGRHCRGQEGKSELAVHVGEAGKPGGGVCMCVWRGDVRKGGGMRGTWWSLRIIGGLNSPKIE